MGEIFITAPLREHGDGNSSWEYVKGSGKTFTATSWNLMRIKRSDPKYIKKRNFVLSLGAGYEVAWNMGCNTLASWCTNKLLFERGLLEGQHIMTWENMSGFSSHIILHLLNHILLWAEKPYTEDRIRDHPMSTIQNIASIELCSHLLLCEKRHWGTSTKASWLRTWEI
mgnify:CR=1 FL=1